MNHTITQKKPGFFRGVRSKFRNLFKKDKKKLVTPVEQPTRNVEPVKCNKEVGYNVYQKLEDQFSKYYIAGDSKSKDLCMFKMVIIGLLFRDYPELFADPSISGIEQGVLRSLDEKRTDIINRATDRLNQIFEENPYYDFGSIIKKWIEEGNISQSKKYQVLRGGSKKSVRKQNKKHTRKSRK